MIHAGGMLRDIGESNAELKQTTELGSLEAARRQSSFMQGPPKFIAGMSIVGANCSRAAPSCRSNKDDRKAIFEDVG